MFFKRKFKKISKTISAAVITGIFLTTVTSISASANDTWISADKVGNYVKDAPCGEIVGSIPEKTTFTTVETVTAKDGSVWGLCMDGTYVCLDYCTNIRNGINTESHVSAPAPAEKYSDSFMNHNQQIIYSHFIEKGFPAESAAAIASNTYDESSCSPASECIDTNDLLSYGICQWNGDRNIRLKNWCYANGYEYFSLDGQLAYLDYELTYNYSHVYNTLMRGGDAWDMGYIWASEFEICSDTFWNTRGNNAESLYNSITG